MNERFPQQTLKALCAAGWHDGRRVDITPFVETTGDPFPAARRVLEEFAGLHIQACDKGVAYAPCDVVIDPRDCDYVEQNWETALGAKLYPLGTAPTSHLGLFIDEFGRVFMQSEICDGFASIARDFDDALNRLHMGLARDLWFTLGQRPGSPASGVDDTPEIRRL